jgi:hypothetical protein
VLPQGKRNARIINDPDAHLGRQAVEGCHVTLNVTTDPKVIRAAPRSLVYPTVDWSVPERTPQRAFLEAADRLSSEHAALGIGFGSLFEEAVPVRAPLSSLGHDARYDV